MGAARAGAVLPRRSAVARGGRSVRDPQGVGGPVAAGEGLGLLDVETILTADKRLEPVRGTTSDGIPFSGYEMHMGLTEGPDRARPFARLFNGSSEGAVSADGRVSGTYIHGLFADDRQRSAWLQRFGVGQTAIAYDALVDETLDPLASHPSPPIPL